MGNVIASVAMATYNGEKYITEQLESILAQTYPVLEIIISDDASQDGTLKILERFQKKYSNIRLYKNTQTTGLNNNFERAVRKCKGHVIALSDQDNIWEFNKLEKMISRLENHILVYSDSLIVSSDNKPIKRLSESKKYKFTCTVTPKEFYFYNAAFGHNTLFQRDLLKDALPFPRDGLNYDGWLPFVASCVGTINYLDEPLVRYRLHSGNMTHSALEKEGPEEPQEPKWQRKQRYNHKLLNRLEVFATCGKLDPEERHFLSQFINEIKKQDHVCFNPNLLIIMLTNFSKLLHHKKILGSVIKSFSMATGVKFHHALR